MRNGKIILISYAIFFAVLAYFATAFSEAVLAIRAIDRADYLLLGLFPLKNIAGILLSLGITGFLWSGRKSEYRKQLDGAIDELKKIVAPTKEETRVTTISVFVFVGIMVVVFFFLDFFWSGFAAIIY